MELKFVGRLFSEYAFLRAWKNWSQCSISCVDAKTMKYGTRTREAECVEGSNGGKTCFDILGSKMGKKIEYESCGGGITSQTVIKCPIDHKITEWSEWSDCPECTTTFRGVRKRKRISTPGKHDGSQCPHTFQ